MTRLVLKVQTLLRANPADIEQILDHRVQTVQTDDVSFDAVGSRAERPSHFIARWAFILATLRGVLRSCVRV